MCVSLFAYSVLSQFEGKVGRADKVVVGRGISSAISVRIDTCLGILLLTLEKVTRGAGARQQ